MKESSPFYMIRIHFHARALSPLMKRPVFSRSPADMGYLIHCALKELFGERAPAPFEIMETKGEMVEVLAYADSSHEQLLTSIRESAPDSLKKAIGQESFSSRKMPLSFPRGRIYKYRVRLCPVIRKARGSGSKAGSEIDVFLAEVERNRKGNELERCQVYGKWFKKMIERNKCVDCRIVRITELKLEKMLRRDRKREARAILKPNVVFKGIWTVVEPDSFRDLIKNGIGRHKAFGFGMVLLKPEKC